MPKQSSMRLRVRTAVADLLVGWVPWAFIFFAYRVARRSPRFYALVAPMFLGRG